jgi:transcriptional regulator
MYLRAAHAEVSLPPLLALIQAHPLGLLTTAIPSPTHPLLQHTYIPWVLDPPTNLSTLTSPSLQHTTTTKQAIQPLENSRLRGHLARANPHAKALIEAASSASNGSAAARLQQEVTVLFSAPDQQHYITPQWYVATKPTTGKVVPTWNYAAVEVRGWLTVFADAAAEDSGAFLHKQVDDLTCAAERRLGFGDDGPEEGGSSGNKAWKVADAPVAYTEVLKKAIVGVEIEIVSVVGKWKMSQELGAGDRAGVVDGLVARDTEQARNVAAIVEAKGGRKKDS